jgi:hypothetical protein
MFFHLLRQQGRGESISLTMPRMSLKSDDRAGRGKRRLPAGRSRVRIDAAITTKSAIAAAASKDPTIRAAMNEGPFGRRLQTIHDPLVRAGN